MARSPKTRLKKHPPDGDLLVILGNGSPTKNAKHKQIHMFPKHVRALRDGNSLDGKKTNNDVKISQNGYVL